MTDTALTQYRVEAYNISKESENKIHDDATARRFGFAGGMVPGIAVYGYMTHLPVMRWGRAWLERGAAECRFAKPVYDGDLTTVTAAEDASGLEITVESRGGSCATGRAALPKSAASAPALAEFRDVAQATTRPPADEVSLAAGAWFGIAPFAATAGYAAAYLGDLRETAGLYAAEGLVHPATLLSLCNWVLKNNVVLGPWIHVGSHVQNFAAARIGDSLTVRARVTANYEHKGHRFVDLDALVVANGATPVARVAHTAIYRPRQVAAA